MKQKKIRHPEAYAAAVKRNAIKRAQNKLPRKPYRFKLERGQN